MRVQYQPPNQFAQTLKGRVEVYLAGQNPRAIRHRMIIKTMAVGLWFAASYVLLVFVATNVWQAVPLAISLGLAIAAVGFNIQHDANHGAYPVGRRGRRCLGFTLDLLGGSSYLWRFQHNVNHHAYTNVVQADRDIDLGLLARLAPSQPRYRLHRFQVIYLWFLYALLLVNWLLWADFRDLWRGRIGDNPFPRPRGWELVALIGGKVATFSLWVVLPLWFHAPAVVAVFALLTAMTAGLTLSVVFQLAHVVEDAAFPALLGAPAQSADDWMTHQLATTCDFAPANRWLRWFLGGLNFQVEHHLFPRVCHLHYPAIAAIVAQTCRDFGVSYHVSPSFGRALASHARLLRRLGTHDGSPHGVPGDLRDRRGGQSGSARASRR